MIMWHDKVQSDFERTDKHEFIVSPYILMVNTWVVNSTAGIYVWPAIDLTFNKKPFGLFCA